MVDDSAIRIVEVQGDRTAALLGGPRAKDLNQRPTILVSQGAEGLDEPTGQARDP